MKGRETELKGYVGLESINTNLNTTQIYLDVIGDDIKKYFETVRFSE